MVTGEKMECKDISQVLVVETAVGQTTDYATPATLRTIKSKSITTTKEKGGCD